ncbi:MAG TPA: flagellar basal body-associated FliL family protein [Alphaproteobacteria bacterium]|nr:flagellar basal body-associated FliL family protein [Alphaproteobacteria bacterium]
MAAKDTDDEDKKEAPEGENPEGGEGAEGEGKKKGPLAFLDKLPPKLKLPILIGVPVLLILLIVLALFLGGVFGKKEEAPKDGEHAEGTMTEDSEEHATDDPAHPPVYYNMPDMIVNLDSRGRKKSVLKMAVTLELATQEDLKAVEARLPRVTDDFQVFLREIRIEDLRGSAGIYRLRQELLARIKPAVAPIKVRDVLFKELLIQ